MLASGALEPARTIWDRVPEPPPKGPKGADRLTIDLGVLFPEIVAESVGVILESMGQTSAGPVTPMPIVVERAMYASDANGLFWSAGSNLVATRLR